MIFATVWFLQCRMFPAHSPRWGLIAEIRSLQTSAVLSAPIGLRQKNRARLALVLRTLTLRAWSSVAIARARLQQVVAVAMMSALPPLMIVPTIRSRYHRACVAAGSLIRTQTTMARRIVTTVVLRTLPRHRATCAVVEWLTLTAMATGWLIALTSASRIRRSPKQASAVVGSRRLTPTWMARRTATICARLIPRSRCQGCAAARCRMRIPMRTAFPIATTCAQRIPARLPRVSVGAEWRTLILIRMGRLIARMVAQVIPQKQRKGCVVAALRTWTRTPTAPSIARTDAPRTRARQTRANVAAESVMMTPTGTVWQIVRTSARTTEFWEKLGPAGAGLASRAVEICRHLTPQSMSPDALGLRQARSATLRAWVASWGGERHSAAQRTTKWPGRRPRRVPTTRGRLLPYDLSTPQGPVTRKGRNGRRIPPVTTSFQYRPRAIV
mmetsp:Transcript_1736/g.3645  ORF Transcript_1736/g.3645 Transcript_1736/m.3645 type:complete len:442 (+) Transcript_1736:1-1326(+)